MKESVKIISKELTWKGLKMQLTNKELCEIFQQEYENDKYYNFELLLGGIYKAFNKEVNFEYFSSWCVLVANCFNYTNYSSDILNKLMWNLAYFFDGISFEDSWNRKRLLYDIAVMKHINYRIERKMKKIKTPFETNGVERILVFDHANWTNDSIVYRVIIKDNRNKQFCLKYIDDYSFEYDENINYTFVNERKFNKIFDDFYSGEWKENHKLRF